VRKIIVILILCAITHAGVCPQTTNLDNIKIVQKELFEQSVYFKAFSIDLFLEALTFAGVQHPKIAFRQAILETGNFKSPLFIEGNNCFGMRRAKYRPSPAIGELNYHATYWHFYDSIRDYVMLQQYYQDRGHPLEEYYTFLENIGYAVDPEYTNKLKNLEIV